MNLTNKKKLAAKVLGVGANKITFNQNSLESLKEAITRQDIRDLFKEGIITIKEARGRKKKEKRKTKKHFGKRKKIVRNRKRDYVIITRKLRKELKNLLEQGKITKQEYRILRKKVKARVFKDTSHLRGAVKK